MERETGFEPATSTLARSHSTTELFPLAEPLKYHDRLDQGYGAVRLKPDATGRPTQLPSSSMPDTAPYRRWRPHFRVVRPLLGQLVASRLKDLRIRIV